MESEMLPSSFPNLKYGTIMDNESWMLMVQELFSDRIHRHLAPSQQQTRNDLQILQSPD